MELQMAALSRVGGRSQNEDACGWWTGSGVSFCVVSDGAGGHRGGEVASKLVVSEILQWFHGQQECSAQAIEAALRHANAAVVREQKNNQDIRDMRATAVVLAIDSAAHCAAWGHLGDSRLYCFRQDHIFAQTRDHSLVQTMIDAGMLEPQDLRRSPERSKLLGAMGDERAFEPRICGEVFTVQHSDKFLLCTDGLWERIEDDEMERTLEGCASAEEWLRLLEQYVLARATTRQDNYSALAVWCTDPAESRAAVSATAEQRPQPLNAT